MHETHTLHAMLRLRGGGVTLLPAQVRELKLPLWQHVTVVLSPRFCLKKVENDFCEFLAVVFARFGSDRVVTDFASWRVCVYFEGHAPHAGRLLLPCDEVYEEWYNFVTKT